MSSQSSWSWEEMVAQFRALGGTIENIRLGTGPRGRGLFAIDPAQPILLRLPEHLLFPTNDIEFAGGRIRLKDTAPAGLREREFFEKYAESFSWGTGGRGEWTAFVEALDTLPGEILTLLATEFGMAKRFEGDAFGRAGKQFLASRQIGWKGNVVLMPLIELANNAENALEYGIGDDLRLEGTVADEVLVSYGAHDPLTLFFNYGYAARAAGAFSLPMKMNVGPIQLNIDCDTDRSTRRGDYLLPELTRDGSRISLSHLMLGHAPYPSVPRGVFRVLTKEIFGANTDEVFDTVRHFNRSRFLLLLSALEPFEGPMIARLEKTARYQLEAISWSIGAADLDAPPPQPSQETEALRTVHASAPTGSTWDGFLDAFRALGGVAENIRLAYGASGRGLFPARSGEPFLLRVPQNLLFPVSAITFEGGKIGIRAEAPIGTAEREFFGQYEETFAWGGGGQAESAAFITALDGLPSEVREHLATQLAMRDILEGDATVRAQNRFLRSRMIVWNGRNLVVPLVELANHRADGVPYRAADFIQMEGSGGDEIFASYRPADAFECFRTFGFASPEPRAFCIPMKTKIGELELVVKRDIEPRAARGAVVMPQLRRDQERLVLSCLPLGHPDYPRMSRGIFRALMRNADVTNDQADEAFDRILHFNRVRFVRLLEALAPHSGKLIVTLRKMARFQLEAMSWCIGVREM